MVGAFNKKSLGPFVGLDLVFAAFAFISFDLARKYLQEGAASIAAPAEPTVFAMLIAAAVIALTVLSIFTLRMDRKVNDEYTFQAMSHAAMGAAFVTLVLVHLLRALPLVGMPPIEASANLTLAILLGSWTIGYAINRIRGTVL